MSPTRQKQLTAKQLELTGELATACGLRPRRLSWPPRGFMTNDREVLEWCKCPLHGTWMQPVLKPYPHWHCAVKDCVRARPAKMRTWIERKIFADFKWMEEHG